MISAYSGTYVRIDYLIEMRFNELNGKVECTSHALELNDSG